MALLEATCGQVRSKSGNIEQMGIEAGQGRGREKGTKGGFKCMVRGHSSSE